MAAIELHAGEEGIAPIPSGRRVLGLWDNFVLWADLGVSFLVMVVGTLLVPALGFWEAMLAILVGAVIGNVLLGVAAAIGSDTRVPTMVLLRAPLGVRGSYAPTALNILQLVGWATLEVIVMAEAADLLASKYLDAPPAYPVWVVAFTALTLVMALGGPIVVTKKVLERFVFWAVLVTTVWITVSVFTTDGIGDAIAKPGEGGMSFWLAVDLVIALPISWFPLVTDYSRFARDRSSAFWGTAAGYFVPHVWFYALGVLLVISGSLGQETSGIINPMLSGIAGLTFGWLALLTLLMDETDEGFANIYSTAKSIQNLAPHLSQRMLIVVLSAIVMVAAWVIPLAEYESFLLLIGAVFVPLLGVLCAHYFVQHAGRYQVDELYQERGAFWYAGGVNWPAIVVWVIGAVTYNAIAGIHIKGLDIEGLAPSWGASLPSFILAFALQLLVGRLTQGQPASRAAMSREPGNRAG